uniref:Uncharacterized protein n=1 Tax=Arundo donax TaxID=35708 RepID=A0A0A9GG11_ARUDO
MFLLDGLCAHSGHTIFCTQVKFWNMY